GIPQSCALRMRWPVYRRLILSAQDCGIPFAVGGGVAARAYTGQSREEKDLDLFILHDNREAMIRIASESGLRDYYEQQPYDRAWIYRGFVDGAIVDLIW